MIIFALFESKLNSNVVVLLTLMMCNRQKMLQFNGKYQYNWFDFISELADMYM